MKNLIDNQKGYVILMVAFFVLIIMSSMAVSMSFLIASRQKNITNTAKSTQSYYAAEAGIEDALLRLKISPQISSLTYDLSVNNVTVNINIPSTIGMSKAIISTADNGEIMRSIKTVYSIDNSQSASFYYGAEIGAGGLVMNNGSEIMGNVFSNGNISGSGTIDNNVVVSGNGHSIQGVEVKGNALAYSCLSTANILGDLTYVTGGSHTCTVGGTTSAQSQEISQQPLPIPQSQIDDWKNDATAGEVFSGDKTIDGDQTLGPVKITGSLNFNNNSTLTLTGTIYVQGSINFGNGDTVKLSNSYNTASGVLLSDGTINTGTGNTFSGSGQTGSYLLIISTDASDSAISIGNNSSGAVFYTTAGGLNISNNVSLVEATGYKVIMNNNAKIQYSSGVVNIFFSSGPGGGWKVTSWQEQ